MVWKKIGVARQKCEGAVVGGGAFHFEKARAFLGRRVHIHPELFSSLHLFFDTTPHLSSNLSEHPNITRLAAAHYLIW